MLIDYSGVHYVIQARQFDGLTGQPSPRVRRDQTRDPEFVAKAAALLIEQDFGLVGVFDRWPASNNDTPDEDQRVTLQLKGVGLGVPLDRWIQEGRRVLRRADAAGRRRPRPTGPRRPAAGGRRRRPPAPPTVVCRVFRRYDRPSDAAGGYRCVQLGTVEKTPVRLRLFQALPDNRFGPLKDALTVEIRHKGFEGEDLGKGPQADRRRRRSVDTTGDKDGLFDRAAFVSVLGADRGLKARVPVPLLDDQPVVLAINVSDGRLAAGVPRGGLGARRGRRLAGAGRAVQRDQRRRPRSRTGAPRR